MRGLEGKRRGWNNIKEFGSLLQIAVFWEEMSSSFFNFLNIWFAYLCDFIEDKQSCGFYDENDILGNSLKIPQTCIPELKKQSKMKIFSLSKKIQKTGKNGKTIQQKN